MKKNNITILKGLLSKLYKFNNASPQKRLSLAYQISKYSHENLKKHNLPMEIEEIFVQCLDMNHWNDKKLPPTLTIEEIRESFIPDIRKIIRKLELV